MLISIGYLGYLISSIKLGILDFEISGSELNFLFWLFLGQFWLFLGSSVCIRFVELQIAVAWALESPQNEFVWGSYVQNTSRLIWKSTIRFLFCSVRTFVPFLSRLESFWGSGICMRLVELRVAVTWALESLQNEFVWESYIYQQAVMKINNKLSVLPFSGLFWLFLGFSFYDKNSRALSHGRVATWIASIRVLMRKLWPNY